MQLTPSSAVLQITLVGYPNSQLRMTLVGNISWVCWYRTLSKIQDLFQSKFSEGLKRQSFSFLILLLNDQTFTMNSVMRTASATDPLKLHWSQRRARKSTLTLLISVFSSTRVQLIWSVSSFLDYKRWNEIRGNNTRMHNKQMLRTRKRAADLRRYASRNLINHDKWNIQAIGWWSNGNSLIERWESSRVRFPTAKGH